MSIRRLSTAALSVVLLCGAASLQGCGKSNAQGQRQTTTVTTTTTGAAPALPVTVDNGSPAMAADPCPSIGTLAETRGGRVALNGARMVRLNPVCSATEMTAHLRNYGDGTRYILVADDLRAGVQPGALFELRLGPPSTGEEAVLGTLNFYAARRPGGPGQPHSISYDVTRQIQALTVSGWPARGLGVAIAPSGEVTPGTDASVGAIRLIAQSPR